MPHLPRIPKLCVRKSGRLYATDPHLKKQIYFKTADDYERWRQDFLARIREIQDKAPEPMTLKPGQRLSVTKLCTAYLLFARGWYRKDGEETTEVSVIEMMIRRFVAVAGDKQADRLRVADIEAMLEKCIADGLSRRTINSLLRKLRRMARWAVRKEVLSGETLGRILSVPALQKGRTEAREKPRVQPVTVETVEATLPFLRQVYRDMVLLELRTGMRPGEVVSIRPVEIDRKQDTWEYTPEHYKTEHRHEDDHRRRRVYLGPKARELLTPYLDQARFDDEPIFRRPRGGGVTMDTYYNAIRHACRKAGIPRWSPNQLRHAAGTEIRKRYGIEAAQVLLGHANLQVSEIYAERDTALAKRIAEEIG